MSVRLPRSGVPGIFGEVQESRVRHCFRVRRHPPAIGGKLTDFWGVMLLRPVSEATLTESLTETQAMAGTLPYMAPEQLRGCTKNLA